MAKRKALSALRKGDDLDISHRRSKKKRRELHRKLYHALTHKKKKQLTLVQKETRRKMLEESKKILADWEKKFAKSRGKISGSQMAAINKLPLNVKKQVLALSRTYATLGRKDTTVDPGRLTFNREMIKAKSEEEREKRKARQSKTEFDRELDAQADKIKSGLGWLLARNKIRQKKLKEGSDGIMKEESDRETMMNYIKKTSEDSYGCTDHDPKHYNKMAREYVMSKYKDGYLKKEVAMQQMGMIGVPKDEVLKMFGVEKAELDEDVPWKVGRGKSYEHKGKEPKSKRAAKFLKMVKDARLSLKNRPKKESIREGEDRVRPNARDWAIKKAQEKDDEKGGRKTAREWEREWEKRGDKKSAEFSRAARKNKVDEAHSEKQLRQASDYHRKIAHNIDNVRDREAPGKLKKAWWALKGKDKFIKANNDKYYGQEKQWQYGHQINRHMQAAKTADELLKRKHFEKKGATDVTKLKWNQLGSNYSDRMKESTKKDNE